MPTTSGNRIIESTSEARQGVTGHNLRYVLILSTVAAVATMIVVFLMFFP